MLGVFIDLNTIDFKSDEQKTILNFLKDRYKVIDYVYVYGDLALKETKDIKEYCSLHKISHHIGCDYNLMNEILSNILQFDIFIVVSDDKDYISLSSYVISQGKFCLNVRRDSCDYAYAYNEVILFDDILENSNKDDKSNIEFYTKTISKSIDTLNANIKSLQNDIKSNIDKTVYLQIQNEKRINELAYCINSLRADVDKILTFIQSKDETNIKNTVKTQDVSNEVKPFKTHDIKLFDEEERAIILFRISNSLIKLQLLERYIKVEILFNALKENDIELLELYKIENLDDMHNFMHALNIKVDAKGLVLFDFINEANKFLNGFL